MHAKEDTGDEKVHVIRYSHNGGLAVSGGMLWWGSHQPNGDPNSNHDGYSTNYYNNDYEGNNRYPTYADCYSNSASSHYNPASGNPAAAHSNRYFTAYNCYSDSHYTTNDHHSSSSTTAT